MNQFTRFEALIGKDKIESLKDKKICVFGLGGVGGNVCDSLIRSGIEHITIIDNDDVNESNINRQLIANMKTIGKAKVDVMEEHLKSLNPNVEVIKFKRFYLPEESDFINFKDYDYVIDEDKCLHCFECINHYPGGCFMRRVLLPRGKGYSES